MKEIPLTQGLVALVDDDDYEWLMRRRWHANRNRPTAKFYAQSVINKKNTIMHRLILGARKGEQVDHINGDGLDNRRTNLRICNGSQNQHNRKLQINNKSGYKGVYFNKRKWTARIVVNNKKIYLGRFTDPTEAARAYDEAAKKLHGEFARTNF